MQISLSQKSVCPKKAACRVGVFTFAFLFPNTKQSRCQETGHKLAAWLQAISMLPPPSPGEQGSSCGQAGSGLLWGNVLLGELGWLQWLQAWCLETGCFLKHGLRGRSILGFYWWQSQWVKVYDLKDCSCLCALPPSAIRSAHCWFL